MNNQHIIVAEDDPIIAKDIAITLKNLQAECQIVQSKNQINELVSRASILIVNIKLRDGVFTSEEITELRKKARKVIVLTGFRALNFHDKFRIQKPFSKRNISDVVNSILR